MASEDVFRFGDFTLDVAERRLSCGDAMVRLQPKARDLAARTRPRCGPITVEKFHETRLVSLVRHQRLPSTLRSWSGDAIGYWAGDALVIDTPISRNPSD